MRYSTRNNKPIHRLHFAWTGWPTERTTLPTLPSLSAVEAAWGTDGLRLIATDATAKRIMLTFEAEVGVTPQFLAQRAKGRLQHAYRQSGLSANFSRKVAVRSLGENISNIVEKYVRDQLVHVDLADPKYRKLLADAAYEDRSFSLAEPVETNSGRYWYNLHIVLVAAQRYRVGRVEVVQGFRSHALQWAHEAGVRIKALAVMPDHLHVALRGLPDRSPLEIGVAIQEATAKAAGCRFWQHGFYAGTFSEYGLGVVRERAGSNSS